MTSVDQKVLNFIVEYYKNNKFYPSYDEIAEGMAYSKSTVHSHMKRLEDEGVIIRKELYSHQYRLINLEFIKRGAECEGQVDSTREEATNAGTDNTGASENCDDMPDSAGGDGAAGQPGNAEGVDRAEAEAAGSGESAENAIKTECGADSEMTDKDWNVLWEDMRRSLTAIRNFMNYTYDEKDLRHNRIPKSVLETKYKEAISVAAGFERILNGKKYSAQ